MFNVTGMAPNWLMGTSLSRRGGRERPSAMQPLPWRGGQNKMPAHWRALQYLLRSRLGRASAAQKLPLSCLSKMEAWRVRQLRKRFSVQRAMDSENTI